MKILYAAGNTIGAHYQLNRFLEAVQFKKHEIRTAAYQKSYQDGFVDYALDSLLNFTQPDSKIEFNGNFIYYSKEIERYHPDLIISDFEFYTSYAAIELHIPVWQYSSNIIYHALSQKDRQNLRLYKFYPQYFQPPARQVEYIDFILKNSSRCYVSSHLCDWKERPELLAGYEWVRPHFIFRNKPTMVDSNPALLADCFYSQQFANINPRYDDKEMILQAYLSEQYGTGKITDILEERKVEVNLDESVKFISQLI